MACGLLLAIDTLGVCGGMRVRLHASYAEPWNCVFTFRSHQYLCDPRTRAIVWIARVRSKINFKNMTEHFI